MNPSTSEYYPETKRQALKALQTYQDGLQIGGGITAENAEEYMKAGASHVIVTFVVFKNGEIYWVICKICVMPSGKNMWFWT